MSLSSLVAPGLDMAWLDQLHRERLARNLYRSSSAAGRLEAVQLHARHARGDPLMACASLTEKCSWLAPPSLRGCAQLLGRLLHDILQTSAQAGLSDSMLRVWSVAGLYAPQNLTGLVAGSSQTLHASLALCLLDRPPGT